MSDTTRGTATDLSAASRSEPQRRQSNLLLICALAWGTSLIHVQAAIDHTSESWLYTLFFIVLASAQLVWGIALYRSPRRGLLVAGAVGSLSVAALWILSRTSGLPIGPDPGRPEQVGLLDVIATANEITVAALIAPLLHPPRIQRMLSRAPLLRGVAAFLILLSSLALAGGTHAH